MFTPHDFIHRFKDSTMRKFCYYSNGFIAMVTPYDFVTDLKDRVTNSLAVTCVARVFLVF